jgi:very-short-patch-repair endonuclease
VHKAGLPPPVPQFPVRLNGDFVGRADFAWPPFRLLVEIDGYEFHKEYRIFVKDRQRQRKTWMAGWQALHFAASEVVDKPDAIIAEVRAALRVAAER